MLKENEALVIIEEGAESEVSTESIGCCWGAFLYVGPI